MPNPQNKRRIQTSISDRNAVVKNDADAKVQLLIVLSVNLAFALVCVFSIAVGLRNFRLRLACRRFASPPFVVSARRRFA